MALTPQQSADYQARIESATSPEERSKAIAERNTALGFGTTKQAGAQNVYTSNTTVPSSVAPTQQVAKQTITYKAEPSMTGGTQPDMTGGAGKVGAVSDTTKETNDALALMGQKYDIQYKTLTDNLTNLTADIAAIDSETNPIIQDIKNTFDRRLAEMKVTNQAMVGQTNLSNVRTNLQRYAPQMAEGLVSAEVSNGMGRLSELESQKIQAVQQAKQALTSQAKDKWKTFNEFMTQATEAYKNKVQTVIDIQKNLKQDEADAQAKIKSDLEMQKYQLETLDTYAKNGTTPTDFELTKFDDALGGKGIAKQYFEAAKAKADEERSIEKVGTIYKTLATIPEGTKVKLGELEYEGTKDAGNLVVKEYDTKTGIATSVTFDKDGNILSSQKQKIGAGKVDYTKEQTTPPVSSQKTGNTPITQPKFNKAAAESEMIKVIAGKDKKGNPIQGSDGKISPTTYSNLKQQWVNAGGNATDFDTRFRGFRDPSNPNYNVGK